MMRAGTLIAAFCVLFGSQQALAVPIETDRLANGLRLFVVPSKQVPMVAIRLVIPGGRAAAPEGKDGAAELLAAMLTDHTARHDHAAWGAWLDAHAIRLSAEASAEAWNFSVLALREEQSHALQALAEAVLAPGFDRKRFSVLQARMKAAAIKAREEPVRLATEAMLPRLFPHHPYGRIPGGTPKSIEAIALADLQAMHRAQFAPEQAALVVAGDTTLAEVKRLAQRFFGHWQGAPLLRLDAIATPRPRIQNLFVAAPTTQSLVVLYRLGPRRHDPDFFAALVANEILGGGGFSSLLMQTLRERHGLVYGAYSFFEPRTQPGPFVIRLQTKADQADAAVRLVRRLLQRLAREGVDAKLVQATTERMAGRFAQQIDSNRERAELVAMMALYGLPLDYLDRWPERVRAVNAEDVRRAMRRWMNPKAWGIIRVGPKGGGR